MAARGNGHRGQDPDAPGVSEPITLTDPDDAVTRVAPWSSWTREQVRRPGGESALVTRLDQGRLWFSSGRPKSPWLHEVHVGPAVVSTPGGRFQVTVEADGGASVACLAGRTRVAAGLEGPVVLGPDQSAAVSSDGLTLVVLDHAQAEGDVEDPLEEDVRPTRASTEPTGDGDPPGAAVPLVDAGKVRRRRWWWVPELAAAAAVLAVLIAAIAVLGNGGSSDGEAAVPVVTRSIPSTTAAAAVTTSTAVTTTSASTTTAVVATTTITTAPTTTAPTTSVPTTSVTRPVSPGASGVGVMQGCRRVPGGVRATVRVRHQAGGPSRFEVTVGAIDRSGAVLAQMAATTETLEPGTIGSVDVDVPVQEPTARSCIVLSVASV